jgi:hypothetical protein
MSHRTRLASATFGRRICLSVIEHRVFVREFVEAQTDTLEETEVKTKLIRRNPMTLYLQQQWHNDGAVQQAASSPTNSSQQSAIGAQMQRPTTGKQS